MNSKKSTHNKDQSVRNENIFCAECGEELNMFDVNGEIDQTKVLERHRRCREKGKFKGDLCSMVFISKDFELPPLFDEAD